MLTIDPKAQSERDNYKLMIGSIVPRPIAFVTSLTSEGVLNAAPFSYFNIVSSNPPMVSVSVQRKQGELKDTTRNIAERGEFVVHVADEGYVEKLNVTAANLPPDESEVELAGLTPVPSDKIAVPGVAEARIRMECVLERIVNLGGTEESPACDLIIGKVVLFHIEDALYSNGRIDPRKLEPVSRMAGDDYAKLGDLFTIARPR